MDQLITIEQIDQDSRELLDWVGHGLSLKLKEQLAGVQGIRIAGERKTGPARLEALAGQTGPAPLAVTKDRQGRLELRVQGKRAQDMILFDVLPPVIERFRQEMETAAERTICENAGPGRFARAAIASEDGGYQLRRNIQITKEIRTQEALGRMQVNGQDRTIPECNIEQQYRKALREWMLHPAVRKVMQTAKMPESKLTARFHNCLLRHAGGILPYGETGEQDLIDLILKRMLPELPARTTLRSRADTERELAKWIGISLEQTKWLPAMAASERERPSGHMPYVKEQMRGACRVLELAKLEGNDRESIRYAAENGIPLGQAMDRGQAAAAAELVNRMAEQLRVPRPAYEVAREKLPHWPDPRPVRDLRNALIQLEQTAGDG